MAVTTTKSAAVVAARAAAMSVNFMIATVLFFVEDCGAVDQRLTCIET